MALQILDGQNIVLITSSTLSSQAGAQSFKAIHLTTPRQFGTIALFDYNHIKVSGYTVTSGNTSCHTSREVSGLSSPIANC